MGAAKIDRLEAVIGMIDGQSQLAEKRFGYFPVDFVVFDDENAPGATFDARQVHGKGLNESRYRFLRTTTK